jgi:hypothetical protein
MSDSFGIGIVVNRAFIVWWRNIVPFTLIAAVIHLPMIIWMAVAPWTPKDYGPVLGSAGLSVFLNGFITATITYGVVKDLQGQRAPMGECIWNGFKRMLPAVGVGLLAGLAMAGAAILLLFPMFIVMCMLYVATPASVIEKPGLLGALRRSRELTAGYKWHIFGLILTMGTLSGFAGAIATMIIRPHDAASFHLQGYLELAFRIFFAALAAVMGAVTYFELRVAKEGTTANELAKVFE